MPIVRLDLRFRLFKQRDKLRLVYQNINNVISKELYEYTDRYINSSISHLPMLNIVLLFKAKKAFEKDNKLLDLVEKKRKMLQDCNNAEVNKILFETTRISGFGLFLNSGSWIIYILPFVLLFLTLRQIGLFASGISKEIQKLTLTPEIQFNKFALDMSISNAIS